jgi:hypothetical protein
MLSTIMIATTIIVIVVMTVAVGHGKFPLSCTVRIDPAGHQSAAFRAAGLLSVTPDASTCSKPFMTASVCETPHVRHSNRGTFAELKNATLLPSALLVSWQNSGVGAFICFWI